MNVPNRNARRTGWWMPLLVAALLSGTGLSGCVSGYAGEEPQYEESPYEEPQYEENEADEYQPEAPGLMIDRALAEVEPSVQRRLLRHLNAARTPEDLRRFPQTMRLEFEHGLPEGAYENQRLNLDPKLFGEETYQLHGYDVPTVGFDRDLAGAVLAARPLNGYTDLREILAVDWERWRPLLDDILAFFGPRVFGRWELLPGDTGRPIMHAALLNTGKVVMLPSSTETVIWNPATNSVEVKSGAMTGLAADLFCSGHSFLADGTLLAVGGGGGSPGSATSIQGWKFDPGNETWTQTASDMNQMRWYPTVVTLDDPYNRVLVASGWTTGTNPAPQMEIYDPGSDSFTPVTATGPVGEKLFGQTYPGLHLLRENEVFYAPTGFGDCTQTADEWSGTEPSGIFEFTASTTGAWADTGVNIRTKGMSVPILRTTAPEVRVVTFGGGDASASGTAQSIDASAASPSWGFAFPMLEHRVHPNAVLLPDGDVFVSGGMEATQATPPNGGRSEIYDPDTGAIFEMDDLHHPRHYHSVSLLLPSGQVMTAGGASPGGCSLSQENTIEVFSPPYLFRGARPTITSVSSTVEKGGQFRIESPDAAEIESVVMVRPMAVTHQTDTEQRVIPLSFTRYGYELRVTAPGGGAPHQVAPRGYYLVFVLDSNGVPSVGEFVRLM